MQIDISILSNLQNQINKYMKEFLSFFLSQLAPAFLDSSLFSSNTKTGRTEEKVGRRKKWFNWPTMPINITKKPRSGLISLCTVQPKKTQRKTIYHDYVVGKQISKDFCYLLGSGSSFWKILGAGVESGMSGGPTVSLKMRLSWRPQ